MITLNNLFNVDHISITPAKLPKYWLSIILNHYFNRLYMYLKTHITINKEIAYTYFIYSFVPTFLISSLAFYLDDSLVISLKQFQFIDFFYHFSFDCGLIVLCSTIIYASYIYATHIIAKKILSLNK